MLNFLHDSPADEAKHAGDDHVGEHGAPGAPKKKPDKNTKWFQIGAVASVLGVIVAYVGYKKSQANAAGGSAPQATSGAPLGTGTVAGSGAVAGTTDAGAGLQASIDNMSSAITSFLAANQPASNTGIPTANNDVPYYARFIDSLSPDSVYLIENGQAHGITHTQYVNFGSPAVDNLSTFDSTWQTVKPVQVVPKTATMQQKVAAGAVKPPARPGATFTPPSTKQISNNLGAPGSTVLT